MRRLSVMRLSGMVRANVTRQLSLTGRNGEAGVVAMLLAILCGTGVLLGCAAITIDTGSLLYERRQLQSGADAAALSIAQTCLNADKVLLLCAAPDLSAGSTLVTLAGANSGDQKSDIASVCASSALHTANPGAFPTTCATLVSPGLVECSATSGAGKFVEVRTATRTGTGSSTLLPPVVAQTLAGGNYTGETVKACSRVGWGAAGPVGPVLFPIAFSYCDWLTRTGALPPLIAGVYQAPPYPGMNPGYGYSSPPNTQWPSALSQVTIYTQSLLPTACATWNGHVAPGNFSTLSNIGCSATVVNGWVQGDTGNSAPCDLSLLADQKGKTIFVPIFDCDTATFNSFTNCNNAHGSADWYHISGYAAFYLTGFYFSSGATEGRSIYPPDNNHAPCNGGDRCVSGWFTTGSLQTSIDTSGAPGFGSYAVQLSG